MKGNFNETNPCPICGKPDWCGYDEKNDKDYVFCHRTRPSVGTVINGYYCFNVAKQCGCFETIEQHEMYSFKKGEYKKPQKKITVPTIPEAKQIVSEKADVNTLNKAYSAFISLLKIDPSDRQHLLNEGWDDDMIRRNMIVSIPPRDRQRYEKCIRNVNPYRVDICNTLIRAGVDLKNVPGFGINTNGKWTFYGPEGMIFPVRNFKGDIIQLRIRPRFSDDDLEWYRKKKKKPPKYMNFTSEGKESGAKCGGYYGVYMPSKETPLCFITEGEKKGIVIAEKRNAIAIALQGVSSFGFLLDKDPEGITALDYLKKRGVKIVAICYDADKATNEHVLQSEIETLDLLKKQGFVVAVCSWNPLIAKGIDDLIWKGLNPSITIIK